MAVKQYKEYGYNVIEFDSLLTHAEYLKPYIEGGGYRVPKEMKSEPYFYGKKTIEKVSDEMKYGDNTATAKLLDDIKQSGNNESDSNTGVFMDIEGVAFDMGSVISGEPECCVAMDSPDVKPLIKVMIDLGYNGDASANVINYRAVGIVNLINTLQAQGNILEVYVVRYATISSGNGKYAQKVKIDTNNLCISQLACASSVGYYRGACWLTTAIEMGNKSYSGESKSDISSEMKSNLRKDGYFYIGGGYSDNHMYRLRSGEDATDYIKKLYNDFLSNPKE